ncbi:MAG: GAF domain-containing protein [Acidobacteriia bacterium]|nr:GAF domain-containing protein [Terriglobia bacterium]
MSDNATTDKVANPHETIRVLRQELEETNSGLIALTLELEQRVDARTAELQEAYAEPQKTNSESRQLTLKLEDRVTQRTEEIRRLNRALRTISECDQAIVRVQEEPELVKTVCRILVEEGGYCLAWVGYAEQDEAKTVRPVGRAGFQQGYLETVNITWADAERGRGPTGTAIRTGQPCIQRHTSEDPDFAPWRNEALQRGYASSIALPLVRDGKPFGALTVCAREVDAFDKEELRLLSDLADDLAFGSETIRARVERKRAEAALQQQAALFDQTYDAVFVWDLHGPITFWNLGAERLYGIPREEALGRACQDLLHTTPPGGVEAFLQALERDGRWEGELEHSRRDGRRIIVETRIVLIRDAEGARVLETNRDITERKQAQEALARRGEELERSNADLEQFAYVASHDLKEPLRAVISFVQLLQRRYQGKLDAQADEFIAHVVDGALRMQKLIDDLLAFSRVGIRGGEFQTVECEKALHAALQNLAVAIQESGTVVAAEALPTVQVDVAQLVLLFQNLIGNALKFDRAQPPRICVSAQRHGAYWQLSVRDNGIGIEPRNFDRIFGVFQRLHTRQEYPGTGIGLAICKTIVERHGGKIWVESEPGKGTTFHFTLPVRHHASEHRPKTHLGG